MSHGIRSQGWVGGDGVVKFRRQQASIEALESRVLLSTVTVTVNGHAQWTDWQGGKHGIPNAKVQLFNANGTNIGGATYTGTTSVNGSFSIPIQYDPSAGSGSIIASIYASNDAAKVSDGSNPVYSISSGAVAVSAAGTVTIPTVTASNSVTAQESFSIIAAMEEARGYTNTLISSGQTLLPQVAVTYPATGSFFTPTTKVISIFKGTYQPDAATGDLTAYTGDNALDWDAVEHEYGHYVMSSYGFAASAGGMHSFFTSRAKSQMGAGLAWNEGFATYFAISAERAMGTPPYAESTPDYGNTSFDAQNRTVLHGAPYFDLKTGVGLGELNEASVCAGLFQLANGNVNAASTTLAGQDWNLNLTDKSMFQTFSTASTKPLTFGAAWEDIVASMTGQQRSQVGQVLGKQLLAPVPTAPANFTGGTSTTTSIPTFTWTANGFNDFAIQFFSAGYKSLIYTTADLGNVTSYTPSTTEWSTIFDGHSNVVWVIEGADTNAPATPGTGPDNSFAASGNYSGSLTRYWGQGFNLAAPKLAILLDVTGSMTPEIGSVQSALDDYITSLESSVGLGGTDPTVDLTTFINGPTEVICSNDLDAVKADIDAQYASGGGDIPEPSAQSLEFVAQNIAPGGSILLITDAPSDAGTDLTGTIDSLRAMGIRVDADISGDDGYDVEPSTDTAPTSLLTGSAKSAESTSSTLLPTAATVAEATTSDDLGLGGGEGSGSDPLQGNITVTGTPAADTVGNTPDTASSITPDGTVVSGEIGETVEDPNTGVTSTNTDDYYAFQLQSDTAYNIPVLTDSGDQVTATLYASDGITELERASTVIGDPGLGALDLSYTPQTTGNYYLDINGADEQTSYSVRVSSSPLVGQQSSIVLWPTIASETGGNFVYDDAIVNNASTQEQTAYQNGIVNVLDGTFEPTVLSANPATAAQGVTLNIALSGGNTSWVQGQSAVTFGDPLIKVNAVTVTSATSLVVNVTVDPSDTVGSFSNVTVTTKLGGSASQTATGTGVVQVTAAPTEATLLQVSPNILTAGQTTTVNVAGIMTAWNASSTLALGPGTSVESVTVISPTQIEATVAVDGAAADGYRQAVVTTGEETDSEDRAFLVDAASLGGIASVSSISPSTSSVGQSVDVAVKGTGTSFTEGVTTADFGAGTTVESVSVTDATDAIVVVDVSPTASAGYRDVALTTGVETAALLDGFLITSAAIADVTGPATPVSPPLPELLPVAAEFTVTLGASQSQAVTIQYATIDGTAIAGVDYTATNGTLTIPAGQTSVALSVTLLPHTFTESPKSFSLTLSSPDAGIVLGTATATATIAGETISSLQFTSRKPLTYTDSLHQLVRVRISGPGTATAYFIGGAADPADVSVAGATAATTLTVQPASRGGPAPIGGIGIGGSLRTLSAANTTLEGDVVVSGSVRALTLGNTTTAGDSIFVEAAGRVPTQISAKDADGLAIETTGSVTTVAAASWASGSLTAGGLIARVKIAGVLGASLSAPSIGSISARAISGAAVRAADTIGAVTTTSITDSLIFAGVPSAADTAPIAASGFLNAESSILSLVVRGAGAFSNTQIAAVTLRSVNIDGAAATGAGTIAAVHFRSLVIRQSSHKAVYFSNAKRPAALPVLSGTDLSISVL